MAITVITTAPTAAQTTEVNKAMEIIENNAKKNVNNLLFFRIE